MVIYLNSKVYMSKLFKILLVAGGINWGLVGLSYFFASENSNWNLVNISLGRLGDSYEAVFYILVGIAALYSCCSIFRRSNSCGCAHDSCKGCGSDSNNVCSCGAGCASGTCKAGK